MLTFLFLVLAGIVALVAFLYLGVQFQLAQERFTAWFAAHRPGKGSTGSKGAKEGALRQGR